MRTDKLCFSKRVILCISLFQDPKVLLANKGKSSIKIAQRGHSSNKERRKSMEDKKKEIDELIQKLDEMLKEGKSNEEMREIVHKLDELLKEYLQE